MRRNIILLILLSLFTSMFTGCYDAKGTDEFAYVIAIGIDRGVSDKWRLTFQFPLMNTGSEGGTYTKTGGNVMNYSTVTIDAASFFDGVNLMNTSVSRPFNFMHTKYLIFSKELAESGKIGDFVAPMTRYREIRRNIEVIISNGSAQNFIKKSKPFIGTLLSKNYEDMINESDDTGYYPRSNLYNLYNQLKSSYSQPLLVLGNVNEGKNFIEDGQKGIEDFKIPGQYYAGEVPRQGGNKIELLGCALMDGNKMVGQLNGFETRCMLIAKGDFKRGSFTIKDPESQEHIIPIDIRLIKRSKVNVNFQEGKPNINLKVFLEGNILAIQSNLNYEDPKLILILEEALTQQIKKGIDSTIKKCKELNCDVFGFGESAVRQFWTIEDWEKYNWNGHFKNATINTEIDFKIARTGTILRSSPVITSEGKK